LERVVYRLGRDARRLDHHPCRMRRLACRCRHPRRVGRGIAPHLADAAARAGSAGARASTPACRTFSTRR
jgi:hypothetical protein